MFFYLLTFLLLCDNIYAAYYRSIISKRVQWYSCIQKLAQFLHTEDNNNMYFVGDADSSRAPGLTSGLQGSVNVHRGALLLVPQ